MMLCRSDALLLGVLAAVSMRNEQWKERMRGAGSVFFLLIPIFLAGLGFLTLRAWKLTSSIMKTEGIPGWRFSTLRSFCLCLPGRIAA